MAQATHLDSALAARTSETSLCEIPLVAGVLKRLAWLTVGTFVAAISLGPLFGPAFASGQNKDEPIRIMLDRKASAGRDADALKCRSHKDGRQNDLLALAQSRLGGTVEHVATRFWSGESDLAEVTFEVWHGEAMDNRRLYIGRGTVDLESCAVELIELT